MNFVELVQAHPVEACAIAYFGLGAIGDMGSLLQAKHPVLAGIFKTCESLGGSILGVLRAAGLLPGAAPYPFPSDPKLPSIEPPSPSDPPPTYRRSDRGAGRVELVAAIGGTVIGLVVANVVLGCGAVAPAVEATAYGVKLADCEGRSSTCAAYVACRDAVQLAEGRGHYRGHCADEDAGAFDSGPVDAASDVGGDQ